MKIEAFGDVITVDGFWDCECDNNYIHRAEEQECQICNCKAEDQPDSRLPEILAEYGDKLDVDERQELAYWLYDSWLEGQYVRKENKVILK
jgi:hypothetical protein